MSAQLEEEKKKSEDLQFSIDEAAISAEDSDVSYPFGYRTIVNIFSFFKNKLSPSHELHLIKSFSVEPVRQRKSVCHVHVLFCEKSLTMSRDFGIHLLLIQFCLDLFYVDFITKQPC